MRSLNEPLLPFGLTYSPPRLWLQLNASLLADLLLDLDVNSTDLATHTSVQMAETYVIKKDRCRDKFNALGLTRDVGASLLAGLIQSVRRRR